MGRAVSCLLLIAALFAVPHGGVVGQATYVGVSARYPTGSAGIADSALVLSFDMETRRADGLRGVRLDRARAGPANAGQAYA